MKYGLENVDEDDIVWIQRSDKVMLWVATKTIKSGALAPQRVHKLRKGVGAG